MAFPFLLIACAAIFFSPVSAISGGGGACRSVDCANGVCRPTMGFHTSIPFECVCHPGWKQHSNLFFLPCTTPTCTIDISCAQAASFAPKKEANVSLNKTKEPSIYNPCSWDICGGGTCKRPTSNSSYSCSCNPGYKNLLNSPSLPCFPKCALGDDELRYSSNLGISSRSKSFEATPDPFQHDEEFFGVVLRAVDLRSYMMLIWGLTCFIICWNLHFLFRRKVSRITSQMIDRWISGTYRRIGRRVNIRNRNLELERSPV